jgi:transcriptional regulator with XRE-family HTH domain
MGKPSPALIKLGAAIRKHRKRAGLTQIELAEMTPCSDKTISGAEVGRDRPSRPMVIALERALKLPPDVLIDIYDLMENERLPGWMRDWVVEERRASMLRSFEMAIAPGLLQTPEYARALLNDNDELVEARLDRQSILVSEESPTLHVVLDETVLYREIGGAQVMYDQLMHLVKSVSERLTVQVIRSPVNPSRSGAFAIGAVEGGEVAYVETAVRGIVTSSREDIGCLNELWESIRSHAMSQEESLEFIKKVAEERWT